MKNKYDGKCYVCGVVVRAGAGEVERVGEKWRGYHHLAVRPQARRHPLSIRGLSLRAGSPAGALIADHLTPVTVRTVHPVVSLAVGEAVNDHGQS